MPWHPPDRPFRDPSVPKLFNLDRAARAGLPVPATWWAYAVDLEAALAHRDLSASRPPSGAGLPLIVRSGSPTEDTAATSNAGRFLSLVVREAAAFPAALAAVIGALPGDGDGRRRGVVFVQPWIEGIVAGVTFFDGFYYEETAADGRNGDLTGGRDRGRVRRGQLERDDPRSDWLRRVHRTFGGRLDLEWVEPARGGRVLLQARPALFPIRRNRTLSLANHKEILGDPPSPWMTGVVVEAGRTALRHYEAVEPAVAGWGETYAEELAERPWINFSFFFRLMDHWGLPRTMVSRGIGGDDAGAADDRMILARLLLKLPAMTRMAVHNFLTVFRVGRELRALGRRLDRARGLAEIQRVNVAAFDLSIRTNLAILMILSVAIRLRRALGLQRAARVVTHEMMDRFAELASRPTVADRLAGLDAWLAEYGHRGPLESDPIHPRFAELRDELAADLRRDPTPRAGGPPRRRGLGGRLARLLFFADEWREQFRDRLMHFWQRLRSRILAEARAAVADGHLDDPEDAFFLRADDLAADPSTWRARAAERRRAWSLAAALDLPATGDRDALVARIDPEADAAPPPGRVLGIGLGNAAVIGQAVRARSPREVLAARELPPSPVLIAPTLEPSWAVVFPRFVAVVAELGGELSHAAILLREAGIPAVVNARGVHDAVADGDRVRVDPARGEVVVEAAAPASAETITGRRAEYLNKAC